MTTNPPPKDPKPEGCTMNVMGVCPCGYCASQRFKKTCEESKKTADFIKEAIDKGKIDLSKIKDPTPRQDDEVSTEELIKDAVRVAKKNTLDMGSPNIEDLLLFKLSDRLSQLQAENERKQQKIEELEEEHCLMIGHAHITKSYSEIGIELDKSLAENERKQQKIEYAIENLKQSIMKGNQIDYRLEMAQQALAELEEE